MKREGAGRHGLWGLSISALVLAATSQPWSSDDDEWQTYGIAEDPAALPGGDDDVAPRMLTGSNHSGGGHSGGHSGAHGTHHSSAFRPLAFVLIALLISVIAQKGIELVPVQWRPPHSVLLFAIGFSMAMVDYGGSSEYARLLRDVETVDPHVVFWMLLPALLYEDSSGSEWHVIKRVIPSSLLLAFPAVMANTILTGLLVQHCLLHSFSFWDSMLLGSMLSATDPVAVVAALRELKAPAKLASLIMGESLFNDGSAFALFLIFLDQAKLRDHPDFSFGESLLRFIRLALGGPAWGLLVGFVVACLLRFTKAFNTQIVVVALGIYGAFFVAEHEAMGLSGVLATVTYGLFMSGVGYLSFNVESEHSYHAVISFLALISHELIFIIAGVVSRALLNTSDAECEGGALSWNDALDLAILYVYIHATRALVVAACFPLLRRWGYGLTWKEAFICVFGGLRGAVGVAMALLVTGNAADSCRIGFHMCGIVFLTLSINGNFIVDVYKALKVYKGVSEDTKQKFLEEALENSDKGITDYIHHCKEKWEFHNCEWQVVQSLIPKLVDIASTNRKDYYGNKQVTTGKSPQANVSDAIKELGRLMQENLENDPNYLTSYYKAKLERRAADVRKLRAQLNAKAGGEKTEEARPGLGRAGSLVSLNSHHFDYLSKLWEGDLDMRVLCYKMVVNVIRKFYHHKLHEGEISPDSFAILKASLSYQDDAIGGELQGGKQMFSSAAQKGADFLDEFSSLPREDQASRSFDVAWRYIDSVLGVTLSPALRPLQGKSFLIDWSVMKRDMELLSAYECTMRHILVDLPMLEGMNQVLADPILSIIEGKMHDAYTDKMMQERPAEFYIADHITCALHVLRHQNEMVTHAVAGGFIDAETCNNIKETLILPSQRALQDYVPTAQAMSSLGTPRKIYSRWNRVAMVLASVFAQRPET